jgi:hypothetical protein
MFFDLESFFLAKAKSVSNTAIVIRRMNNDIVAAM